MGDTASRKGGANPLAGAIPVYEPTSEERAEATRIAADLRAKGYVWHSFARRWYRDRNGIVRLWFNGSYVSGTAGLKRQPAGWFTLAEMRAEKFAEGCR